MKNLQGIDAIFSKKSSPQIVTNKKTEKNPGISSDKLATFAEIIQFDKKPTSISV